MNQILCTGGKQEKSNINNIVRVFCIIIIVFSIFFIAQGTYALIANKDENVVSKSENAPKVNIESQGGNAILKVTSNKSISKIVYSWNDGQESEIQTDNKTEVEETLTVPNEDCVLNIKIIDSDGAETEFRQEFKFDPNVDTKAPEVKISAVPGKIIIEAKDNKEMDYIIYKWNDEQENKVQASGDDLTKIVQNLDVKKGKNKLTVIAVDKSGNKKEKQDDILGASKPKISVGRSGGELVIKVTDEDEITKVEYNINGTTHTKEDIGDNKKEFEFREALKKGENAIVIRAYNKSGLTQVYTGKCTY